MSLRLLHERFVEVSATSRLLDSEVSNYRFFNVYFLSKKPSEIRKLLLTNFKEAFGETVEPPLFNVRDSILPSILQYKIDNFIFSICSSDLPYKDKKKFMLSLQSASRETYLDSIKAKFSMASYDEIPDPDISYYIINPAKILEREKLLRDFRKELIVSILKGKRNAIFTNSDNTLIRPLSFTKLFWALNSIGLSKQISDSDVLSVNVKRKAKRRAKYALNHRVANEQYAELIKQSLNFFISNLRLEAYLAERQIERIPTRSIPHPVCLKKRLSIEKAGRNFRTLHIPIDPKTGLRIRSDVEDLAMSKQKAFAVDLSSVNKSKAKEINWDRILTCEEALVYMRRVLLQLGWGYTNEESDSIIKEPKNNILVSPSKVLVKILKKRVAGFSMDNNTPTIVLPHEKDKYTLEKVLSTLAHELTHNAQRENFEDCLLNLLGELTEITTFGRSGEIAEAGAQSATATVKQISKGREINSEDETEEESSGSNNIYHLAGVMGVLEKLPVGKLMMKIQEARVYKKPINDLLVTVLRVKIFGSVFGPESGLPPSLELLSYIYAKRDSGIQPFVSKFPEHLIGELMPIYGNQYSEEWQKRTDALFNTMIDVAHEMYKAK